MFEVHNLDASGHYSDGSYSHWDWAGSGSITGRKWSGLARVQWASGTGMFELRRNDWVGYWPRHWRAYQHVDSNGAVLRCYLDLDRRSDAFACSVKEMAKGNFIDVAVILGRIADQVPETSCVPDDLKKVVHKKCSGASSYLFSARREN